jgi:hypothetical protein
MGIVSVLVLRVVRAYESKPSKLDGHGNLSPGGKALELAFEDRTVKL